MKLVDLAVPNAGPHDHRKDDPYDAAFFEHLSHISTLESLNVISTKANDEWIKLLGKLSDADLSHPASITQLKSLIMDRLPLPDERLPLLSAFAHLKMASFALRPPGYAEETQAKVKALLPKVDVKFAK